MIMLFEFTNQTILIMRKIVLVIAVVLFAAFAGNAQIKFGPKVGMNLSTITQKYGGISLDAKMLVGYHIGATLQADIASNFFIQPSILFSSKGSKYKDLPSEMGVNDFKIVANYIDVPIDFGYKFKTSNADILLMVGPYFAYGVGGYYEVNNLKEDSCWGSGEDDDAKPLDMGVNIGAGLEVSNFQFSIQYGFGLLNLSPQSGMTYKNNVLGISVAYLF